MEGKTVAYFKLFLTFGLKICLALVALCEAFLIVMSDFSGYMFDVVILSMALGMTLFCLIRAIRNYMSEVSKLSH
jgi:hypothetical protein